MNAKKLIGTAVAAGLLLLGGGAAHAALVECGNNALGIRLTAIDPGLTGGFCYAQNGNFNGDNFGTLAITNAFTAAGGTGALVMRGKEKTDDGDVASSLLDYTGARSGTWDISNTLWANYGRVFLAFHFGGGGNTTADNPDSFIVELARPDVTGRWALTGTGAQLNDLSNIYVLSNGTCTANCGGGTGSGGGGTPVPEPGSLALAGLALLGLVAARKRSD